MHRSYVYRYIWFFVGVIINSFGVAFITKAAMGTSPISSIPYVLDLHSGLSFGATTFLFNILLILAQIVILKKDYKKIQLLQIIVNIVFSVFIDISMSLLFWLEPVNIVEKLISLAVGCAILGFGISIEVAPGALMVPGEGLVSAIASKLPNKKFGTIKICFDVSLMLIAAILSLIISGGIDGLGLGTIISALVVGKFVNIFNKRMPLIPRIAALKAQ
ncbi:MAG TPA: YitT family protein [Candidatus Ornithomonoglobus merdipullorum]|uniref:YitT family protein n=1 Tax=Candidatus Ornithomonoglobus merdipullorum TaxID=2840895 RepID=A0A9D1MDS5_9FIRM|nr:YitT family protein [Candidatus Ornithomonoglobus merdipullorum]